MHGRETFDHERVSFNLARLKKGGETFEVVVDPDAAIRLKESGRGDVDDVVKAQKVFADASRGMLAGQTEMLAIFGTENFEQIAAEILKQGEIQLTTEHRDKVREQKLRVLVAKIHRNAIDPKTGNPHPEKRIELAFEEAKIKVDEFRTVDQQLGDVVKKLQPILPLRFETAQFAVRVLGHYAGKVRGEAARMGKVLKEEWLSDGGWSGAVEIPAGLKTELIDTLNSLTHGTANIEEKKK
jgi:ribosome maturation protein SDO1